MEEIKILKENGLKTGSFLFFLKIRVPNYSDKFY